MQPNQAGNQLRLPSDQQIANAMASTMNNKMPNQMGNVAPIPVQQDLQSQIPGNYDLAANSNPQFSTNAMSQTQSNNNEGLMQVNSRGGFYAGNPYQRPRHVPIMNQYGMHGMGGMRGMRGMGGMSFGMPMPVGVPMPMGMGMAMPMQMGMDVSSAQGYSNNNKVPSNLSKTSQTSSLFASVLLFFLPVYFVLFMFCVECLCTGSFFCVCFVVFTLSLFVFMLYCVCL